MRYLQDIQKSCKKMKANIRAAQYNLVRIRQQGGSRYRERRYRFHQSYNHQFFCILQFPSYSQRSRDSNVRSLNPFPFPSTQRLPSNRNHELDITFNPTHPLNHPLPSLQPLPYSTASESSPPLLSLPPQKWTTQPPSPFLASSPKPTFPQPTPTTPSRASHTSSTPPALRSGGSSGDPEPRIFLENDLVALKSSDDVIFGNDNTTSTVLARRLNPEGIPNWMIMSKPGSPFLRRWLERYEGKVAPGTGERVWEDDMWKEMGFEVPTQLAMEENPGLAFVLDGHAWFYPLASEEEGDVPLKKLWFGKSWDSIDESYGTLYLALGSVDERSDQL
ncbi:hypothetical protein ABVK25_012476 [Lepraria finkii]|uniref:Uncharacterized protein n=1 Tax=Lepraria finkii TaxID=1340010 RepID=A0ABR4AG29_9LECA